MVFRKKDGFPVAAMLLDGGKLHPERNLFNETVPDARHAKGTFLIALINAIASD